MRLKLDPLFSEAAEFVQAKDLKSAAIRENRMFPGDESMQSSHPVYRLIPRPKIKVISIAEYNLGPRCFEHLLSQGLDGALSAYKHEGRRIKSAVSSEHASRARPSQIVGRNLLK